MLFILVIVLPWRLGAWAKVLVSPYLGRSSARSGFKCTGFVFEPVVSLYHGCLEPVDVVAFVMVGAIVCPRFLARLGRDQLASATSMRLSSSRPLRVRVEYPALVLIPVADARRGFLYFPDPSTSIPGSLLTTVTPMTLAHATDPRIVAPRSYHNSLRARVVIFYSRQSPVWVECGPHVPHPYRRSARCAISHFPYP